jgi:hypothetical protein
MADERLPFIRGRIERADSFRTPTTPITPPRLPQPDPTDHQRELTRQLDALQAEVRDRANDARDQDAAREIGAVVSARHPATREHPGSWLEPTRRSQNAEIYHCVAGS